MPTKIEGGTGVDKIKEGTVNEEDLAFTAQKMLLIGSKNAAGTSIDFSSADGTEIPSWAKRITVMFNGVSTSGTSIVQVQLGTSSGIEVSGYFGSSSIALNGSAPLVTNISTGIGVFADGNASYVRQGSMQILKLASNTWCSSYVGGDSASLRTASSTSSKTLLGTLNRIRITTVNGTDTFDAGSVSILVEGY